MLNSYRQRRIIGGFISRESITQSNSGRHSLGILTHESLTHTVYYLQATHTAIPQKVFNAIRINISSSDRGKR